MNSRKQGIHLNIPPVLVRLLLILALAAFLRGVYTSADAADVSMESIRTAMLEKTKISSLQECHERKLLQFMGINYQNYDSYIYYKSKESLGVDEVLVVKVKNTSDLEGLKDAVESRIKSQEKVFDGYGTEQMKLLKNGIVETKGKYLFYCVSEDSAQYEEVFRDAVQ